MRSLSIGAKIPLKYAVGYCSGASGKPIKICRQL